MATDIFTIKYSPVNLGTGKTDILFYESDSAQIVEEVLASTSQNTPRIFVTDTTVISLPLMKEFAKTFGVTNTTQIKKDCVFKCKTDVLAILGSGERHKTIGNVLTIVKAALDNGLQRSSLFVGIGGGVICDMTAFAASVFKRGAKLELVPTTLLAMVDAAVGGKTGCDFGTYKNMLGTFYPASRIHVFSGFVQLLPESEYRSGLAETLKTAMLYAPKLFDTLQTQQDSVKKRSPEIVRQMVRRCVIAKANIVEKDLTENGPRMQLNLGHTFGHALESIAGLGSIPHGDAVAWGIGRAMELSLRLGLCEKEYRDEIFGVLQSYGWETNPIHPVLDLPEQDKTQVVDSIIDAMKKDKKNDSDSIRCVLQRDINSTVIQEVQESDIKAVLEA